MEAEIIMTKEIRMFALLLALNLWVPISPAQESADFSLRLARGFFKNGDETLRAFAPIARATRQSVVKIDLNGTTVALAAVVNVHGLAITKGSEIKEGKLTAWLASGKEVKVDLVKRDEKNDLAFVKVNATGLKPIQWAAEEVPVGQMVVTPGIAEIPQAVGIVSVRRRKILPKRALIGVQLDPQAGGTRIGQVMRGLGAEKAGLKPGDRIVAVNDRAVSEREDLLKTLRQFRDGQAVKLRVKREEDEFEASVMMTAPKPDASARGLDREERMNRMGSETSERAEDFELAIQHDTVLQAWQCGGPLVNLEGKAVGLNIARAGRVASYALPAAIVQQAIREMMLPEQPAGTQKTLAPK